MNKTKQMVCAPIATLTLIGSLIGGANAATTVLTDGILSSSLTASSTYSSFTPDKAFDSDTGTRWNANTATGWIEMDIGTTVSVSGATLTVRITPNGSANHQIWVSDAPIGNDTSSATLAHTLSGSFVDEQVLTPTFTAVEGRYVQLKTTSSVGWVAWSEIAIQGNIAAVPEPSSAFLLGFGALSFILRRSRR